MKLIDFGCAKIINNNERAHSFLGTTCYIAPEIIMDGITEKGYDKVVDLWSLGVLLYEMLVGYKKPKLIIKIIKIYNLLLVFFINSNIYFKIENLHFMMKIRWKIIKLS